MLAALRRWFAEFDAAAWDRELEADVANGELNGLIREAAEDDSREPRSPL